MILDCLVNPNLCVIWGNVLKSKVLVASLVIPVLITRSV